MCEKMNFLFQEASRQSWQCVHEAVFFMHFWGVHLEVLKRTAVKWVLTPTLSKPSLVTEQPVHLANDVLVEGSCCTNLGQRAALLCSSKKMGPMFVAVD